MPLDPGIIGAGISAVAGLFGKREKYHPPSENIWSLAEGARDAGKHFGFNPLTLLKTGAQASVSPGSAPPLASMAILGNWMQDEFSQDTQDRREHNRLANELLALQVEEARTLRGVAPPSAVADMGGTPGFSGGRTSTIGVNSGSTAGTLQMKILGGREILEKPTEDLSGFMRIRNGITDDDGFLVPGSDGEPLDIWQVPVVAGSWVADKAWDLGSALGDKLAESDWSPLQQPAFEPAGFTEDGKPFWKRPDGTGIQFTKPSNDDFRKLKMKGAY